ncbi:ABC transporter ATP-binding protein [Desulfatiglans anilini]|uniref:ABC transporter ATP-binding protein n=1 Tax=Desulfatiglans anilini TaxID=90728 RepID=UPI001ABFEA87|nr:ABC transporter ATP-binding protein [Desulfatiglans anilini]
MHPDEHPGMIVVEGLSKYYGRIPAVTDVSFHVEPGEIVGLLGPNGAGKTTILRVLTGYMPPTSGRVLVGGRDACLESLAVRKGIGFLPENVPLYSDLSVLQFLRFAASAKGVARDRLAAEIRRVLEISALMGYESRLIRHLSKGLRQRVGLAQALLNDPPLLILDEPTTGLDPSQIVEMREMIRGLGGERTVVLSTHILPEVSQLCRRVIIINKGRIVAEDTPEGLGARLASRRGVRTAIRVDAPEAALNEGLLALDGVLDVHAGSEPGSYEVESEQGREVRAAIARFVVSSGWPLYEMTQRDPSLEEIFVRLVTEEEGGTR